MHPSAPSAIPRQSSSTARCSRSSHASSRATKSSTARTSPAISSLPAFSARPQLWKGAPDRRAASTRSARPSRRPEACGPRSAFPPEKATRSAPSSRVKRQRLEAGGSWAAASTSTGTPRSRAMRTTVGSGSATSGRCDPAT
nr:hypothetical protein [Pseudolysinimonas kribbensis]